MSDTTTLLTFMLQAPSTVLSVELLGSWDNFSISYPLKQDRRMGVGHWRGCHVFENITCDGDPSDSSTSRDGGLMMGGKYWYYYRFNGEAEHHDTSEPFTNSCPLLPGQTVNVLDVPTQLRRDQSASRSDSSSSIDSMVFTLDPRDKYLPPGVRRAATTSAIKSRKSGLDSADKRTPQVPVPDPGKAEDLSLTSTLARHTLTLERQRSLPSIFNRLRRTKSAGSNLKATLSRPRNILSRSGSRAGKSRRGNLSSDEIPEVPKLPCQKAADLASDNLRNQNFELPIQQFPTADIIRTEASLSSPKPKPSQTARSGIRDQGTVTSGSFSFETRNQASHDQSETFLLRSSFESQHPRKLFPHQQVWEQKPHHQDLSLVSEETNPIEQDGRPYSSPQDQHHSPIPGNLHVDHRSGEEYTSASPEGPHNYEVLDQNKHHSIAYSYAESLLSSYASSDNFSPFDASNTTHSGPMSPLHLSQPETPVMGDYEDHVVSLRHDSEHLPDIAHLSSRDFDHFQLRPPSRAPPPPPPPPSTDLPPKPPYLAAGGFQGYSLPETDQASVLTIRKLPSATFKPLERGSLCDQQSSRTHQVHSWNDGSQHRMTGLENLAEDLGYLGELIN